MDLSDINTAIVGDVKQFEAAKLKCRGLKTSFNNKLKTAMQSANDLKAEIVNEGVTELPKREADKAELELATAQKATKPQIIMPAFNIALKPFELSISNTLAEYRSWKDDLRSFFRSNHLEDTSIFEQNGYVKSCLDCTLSADMTYKMDPSKHVNDPVSGIMALIEEAFVAAYPTMSRRLEWASCKQQPGEEPDSYMSSYNAIMREADFKKMSADDFAKFGLISGINDKYESLRQKLMAMKDTTYVEVQQKLTTYMATKRTNRKMGESSAKVMTVKSQGQGKSPNQRTPFGPPLNLPIPAHIKITPETNKGRCSKCGQSGHMGRDCSQKNTARCTKCDKDGHCATTCLAEYFKWSKPLDNGGQEKKAPSGKAQQISDLD
ncbi:hypothetical protein TCAL_14486 [Tigriopus californicus]|uniref:CCHC-type domain-containing protein n=1 Tax=Tigriopus californicus TaxID=6832 RepID=A0A553PSQ9_TIGCA|nr:hypothetical protein TCAL_14486 [Tigriopus californicus]